MVRFSKEAVLFSFHWYAYNCVYFLWMLTNITNDNYHIETSITPAYQLLHILSSRFSCFHIRGYRGISALPLQLKLLSAGHTVCYLRIEYINYSSCAPKNMVSEVQLLVVLLQSRKLVKIDQLLSVALKKQPIHGFMCNL